MDVLKIIIDRQITAWERARRKAIAAGGGDFPPPQIITVSRASGSRGMYLAHKLAEKLGYQLLTREHIDYMATSEDERQRIKASIDDESRKRLQQAMKNLRPFPSMVNQYARNLYETMLPMARLGGVLLVGRGANFIFGLKRGFHIRVVCGFDLRIENYARQASVSPEEAARVIEKSDKERRKFVKKLFDADIDDPHYYDIVVNSEFVDFEELIPGLVTSYRSKMNKLKRMHRDGLLH
ncbi:MAG: cytidylate kinase-like family protein [candidate division Zixibacteria bacterium]|nr:cytidylate kinase-like family protein [candidate division Zixibacteria bacterium]